MGEVEGDDTGRAQCRCQRACSWRHPRGHQEMIARREVQPAWRVRTDPATALVIRGRRRRDDCRIAGMPGTQAEVEIFEREAVILVEQADGIEDFASDQHHAAADAVNPAGRYWFTGADAGAGVQVAHAAGAMVVDHSR